MTTVLERLPDGRYRISGEIGTQHIEPNIEAAFERLLAIHEKRHFTNEAEMFGGVLVFGDKDVYYSSILERRKHATAGS